MSVVWINGNFIPSPQATIPVNDSGVANAIGVFDTMRAEDGSLVHGAEHFARLIHDARILIRIAPDYSETRFIAIAQELLARCGLNKGVARVRTTVTGGIIPKPLAAAESLSVFMTAAPVPASLPDIHAWIIADYPRVAGSALETIKRIDYSRSYAARRDAEARGGNEAILTNTNGMVVCASTSNLFIVEDGQWFTPPLSDGALDGITRRHVIAEKGVREESMLPERVLKASAVHLSNSITGLRRVSSLNGNKL